MKSIITFLLSMCAVGISHAGVFDQEDLSQAYAYLNQIRVRAGMTEFSQNPQLETAAFNHANYLADNFLTGHYESEGSPGFTGVSPKERTIFAGYHSSLISENISYYNEEKSSIVSINNLMGAIYHRLAFLDFVNNEVGIGIAHMSGYSVHVYNMGNSEYNALCQEPSFSGAGSFYSDVCEPNIKIEANDFENVAFTARGNNPNIVLWPADGDNEVPPAFFEENPDPLPDYSVSGYPISIQFNPLVFSEEINVSEFKLYREQDDSEIQATRLLSKSTDPNGRFSAFEYVLFPLERLEWDTAYRVEAKYSSNLGTKALKWHFKTRSLGVPLFSVQGEDEVIEISPNSSAFAVYVPPTSDFPNIGNYSFSSDMAVDVGFEDANTLRINLSGQVGQEASFSFSGGRRFVVRIVDNCEVASLSSDFKVHIPRLVYTLGETELVFEADLAFVGGNLLFKVSNYSIKNNAEACESASLSSDLKLHIPTLVYTPSPGELPLVLWADFELFGDDLQFQVTNYGFK
ncbi:MAG: CAP domain-containing protein [Pseudomonadota bacterium]